jgi:hypothetical protein
VVGGEEGAIDGVDAAQQTQHDATQSQRTEIKRDNITEQSVEHLWLQIQKCLHWLVLVASDLLAQRLCKGARVCVGAWRRPLTRLRHSAALPVASRRAMSTLLQSAPLKKKETEIEATVRKAREQAKLGGGAICRYSHSLSLSLTHTHV